MGWPSEAVASLFFGPATEGGLAPRLETVPISAHRPTKRTTQSRNVVCLRHRRRLCALRERRAPLRGGFDGRYRQEEAEPLLPRGHAAGDSGGGEPAGPLALVDRAAGMEDRAQRDHALPLGE